MKTSDFYFELPEYLIAQEPPRERGQSRLMTLDCLSGKRTHETVSQLPEILCTERFLSHMGEKPLLVFNDTRVRKARLFGKSLKSGALSEFLLIERVTQQRWKAMAKRIKRKKANSLQRSVYVFFDNRENEIARAAITGFEGNNLLLEFDRAITDEFLDRYGHIPLPPYIKRADVPADAQRYQTIYAKHAGSAAAPTAGLHFTRELLDALKEKGIKSAFVTLHVGPGTFLPVRSEQIEDYVMHEEQFMITEENAAIIENAIAKKLKIVAVGTTSLRTLESAFCEEGLKRGWQSTSIFIYPGYKFNAADALFTNFHTPESTLLMLVSAFAGSCAASAGSCAASDGRSLILESYAEAVKEKYRFFSYGDAMLIY